MIGLLLGTAVEAIALASFCTTIIVCAALAVGA
jgi:hypothetical protein